VASAILAHALESGVIAAALVTRMCEGNPPRPRAVLAKTLAELRAAQKSKYCPVPLLDALDEVKKLRSPIAVVGVPCQIHGLRNILRRFARFGIDVAFTVGLICDRVLSYRAIDYLLRKSRLESDASTMLHYRDKEVSGFPGDVHAMNSHGSVVLPARERQMVKSFFSPPRCLLCFDKMNILADIVVGDPHGIQGVDRVGGESAVVIRTDIGMGIFRSAAESRMVVARKVPYTDILKGQQIDAKRAAWRGYVEAWRDDIGRPLPNYCERVQASSRNPKKRRLYSEHLRHGIALDDYASRQLMITTATRQVGRAKLMAAARHPVRALAGVMRRCLKKSV